LEQDSMSRYLALAIIHRAVEDAADARMPAARRAQARAFVSSADCAWWCHLAGVDHGEVRRALARRAGPGD
jgi:hypothetical protein